MHNPVKTHIVSPLTNRVKKYPPSLKPPKTLTKMKI